MSEFILTSPAFDAGGTIPREHTRNGDNLSPPLEFSGIPAGTVTLAVIMDDVTDPAKPVNGWALWNVPPLAALPAGVPAEATIRGLGGAVQSGAYHNHSYRGPKRVRFGAARTYKFTAYALDTVIDEPPTAFAEEFLATAHGHILGQASLSGTYKNEE